MYLATYWIWLCFKLLLHSQLGKLDIMPLLFDKSLNTNTQSCERDVVLRYWNNENKRVDVLYLILKWKFKRIYWQFQQMQQIILKIGWGLITWGFWNIYIIFLLSKWFKDENILWEVNAARISYILYVLFCQLNKCFWVKKISKHS